MIIVILLESITSFLLIQQRILNSQTPLICIMPVQRNIDELNSAKNIPTQSINNSTHSHIPTSISINNRHTVGEIPFTSALSSSGGVAYSVPIQVSEGRGKLQPNISLNYNSQGTNDVLGYEWSLGGLSAITCTPKNIYFDREVNPILLNTDDVYMLDGVRLLQRNDLKEYLEPVQGNARVKKTYVNGNIIGYFIVEYPNGTRARFGFTDNTSQQITYPITQITDATGNQMDYSYTKENGRYYINKISYGANSSGINTHFAEVRFTYKSRTDITSRYEKGILIKQDRLLANIICRNGSYIVHSYSFTYQMESVSLLSKINSDTLNPLLFYYGYSDNVNGELNEYKTTLMTYFDTQEPLVVSKGKFSYGTDNDGLIVYPDRSPCSTYYKPSSAFHHSIYYYYSDFNPEQKLLIYQNLGNELIYPTELSTENGFQTLFSADVDGKPGEEVIKINNWLEGSVDRISIKTYKPDLYSYVSLTST